MLRITVHQESGCCRLKLAGRLAGPWVPVTEKAWRSELCSAATDLEVDMNDVTAIDSKGRELLVTMCRAGTRLIARGVEMKPLVEEIARRHASATRRPLQKKEL
jgi:hypothetical protein